jgi:hypothetical protein
MIAVASSGASFGRLANYLVRERTDGPARVAWSNTRNLPTEDVKLAAYFMHATAAQNVRVEKPVYHLAVSFHPEDPVTRPMMERVADRLLTELKLTVYQAVIVAHADRSHPHMHLMINRIHPDSYRAWDRWMDWSITQRVLREEELALGLRQTRGRLHALEGQSLAHERPVVTGGEYREAHRSGVEPLVERVRAYATELRAAVSWDALHARLRVDGLRIERKGQGLVITDGDHQVKASRIHRELSFARLEGRIGAFREITQEITPTPDDHHIVPAVPNERIAVAADLARQTAYRHRLSFVDYLATQAHTAARDHVQCLERDHRAADAARSEFQQRLDWMYIRPDAARGMFERLANTAGIGTAVETIRRRPDAFGPLQTVTVKRYLGLVRIKDATRALGHARAAARAGETAHRMAERLRQTMERPVGPLAAGADENYAHALARAQAHERHTSARLERVHAVTRQLPALGVLDRTLARAVLTLTPPELRQLAQTITAPQHVLAMKTVEIARQIALGQERGLHI